MVPTSHRDPPAFLAGASTPTEPIDVLVVAPEAAVRNGIRRLVDRESDLAVTVVAGWSQALAEAESVHIAVVDNDLGDGQGGLALARALGALDQPPRVLVFSSHADTALAVGAIAAGADGLLGKASLGDELCDAIRVVASGGMVFPPIPRDFLMSLIRRLHVAEQWVVESRRMAGPNGGAGSDSSSAVSHARAAAKELRR